MLPECLDDYVDADNPVRALDHYVETLNLGELKFDLKSEGTVGRPLDYRPQVLLKILIYGYLNQIRSSRKLEKQTKVNLELIWLAEKAQPDHWTINDFRRRNGTAFKQVLRNFHRVCDVLELFGKELLAGDGSFFKALNNASGNYTRSKLDKLEARIDAAIEAYNEALEEDVRQDEKPEAKPADEDSGEKSDEPVEVKNLRAEGSLEELQSKKAKIEQLQKQVEESESGQVSINDPDSRLLKKGNQSVVGHNVQCSVDGKHTLIAHIEIVQAGNDTRQLEPLARNTCEALGIRPGEGEEIDFVADGGYVNHAQMSRLEEDHIQVHVPEKRTRVIHTPGYETGIDFCHDPEKDEYICPQGNRLTRHQDTTSREITYRVYYNTAACRSCPVREKCTRGKYRKIRISEYREMENRVAARLKERPEVYARRKEIAELPFGTLKSVWGYRQFMVTGKQSCEGELNLMAWCFNWKRVLNLVGMEKLMEAIAFLSAFFCRTGLSFRILKALEGSRVVFLDSRARDRHLMTNLTS